eukprot:SAG22_NODE_366_length_11615_cov_13.379125_2_plen_47_part_00
MQELSAGDPLNALVQAEDSLHACILVWSAHDGHGEQGYRHSCLHLL